MWDLVIKVALWQVFSKYFSFPCQFSFVQMLHTHLSSKAGTIGQLVANEPGTVVYLQIPSERECEISRNTSWVKSTAWEESLSRVSDMTDMISFIKVAKKLKTQLTAGKIMASVF
jgi:hypothetical protein